MPCLLARARRGKGAKGFNQDRECLRLSASNALQGYQSMSTTCAHHNTQSGFTLLELMIVVAIIAILSAIAMPIYSGYITRSKVTEATNNLSAYRVSMEQYYQDNRKYGSATGCGIDPGPISNTLKYFALSCTPAAATTTVGAYQSYVATATGKTGTAVAGFSYTIDNAGNKASTAWGGSQNCWITAKGTCQ
jgi:type IV pilus assembly protein PilE